MSDTEQRLFLLLESVEQLKDAVQKQLDAVEYTRTQTAGITKYHHELESRLNSAVERIENVQMTAEKIVSPLHEPIEKSITNSIEKSNKVERDRLNASIRDIDNTIQGVRMIVDDIEKNYEGMMVEIATEHKKFLDKVTDDCENSIMTWKLFSVPLGAGVFAVLCLLLVWLFVPSRADIADQRKQMADAKEAYTMYVGMQKDLEVANIKHGNGTTYIKVNTGNCITDRTLRPTKTKFCSVD